MLTIPWNSTTGWGTPKIQPYAPLQLDPSSTVLHYAPTLFEGLKAYKGKDGVPRLFRPDKVRCMRGRQGGPSGRTDWSRSRLAEHGAHEPLCGSPCLSCTFLPVAERVALFSPLSPSQTFTGDNVTQLIKKLVEIDADWVPTDPGTSLCVF